MPASFPAQVRLEPLTSSPDMPAPADRGTRRFGLSVLARMARTRPAGREELREAAVRRILVVRQDDRIGNLLFITPLLRGLAGTFPGAAIDVVVSGRFREILASHPAVAELILMDRRGFRRNPAALLRSLQRLRASHYDLVLDCKRGASLSNAFVVAAARARYRIGFRHEFADALYSHAVPAPRREPRHESERLYSLLDGIWDAPPCPPMEFHFPPGRAPRSAPEGVSMHIGGHGGKRIPRDTLIAVLDALRSGGRRVEVLAGPEEANLVGELEARFPGLRVTRPPDIVALAERIAASRVFVGPDTGALHLASALDVPSVNLFPAGTSPVYGPRSTVCTVIDFREPDAATRAIAFVDTVLRQS